MEIKITRIKDGREWKWEFSPLEWIASFFFRGFIFLSGGKEVDLSPEESIRLHARLDELKRFKAEHQKLAAKWEECRRNA
ncbi:MAG: hypothetical protein LBV49_07515 [Azonexus sp.]|jgi:hypothetical protein|nr:hypothetical protein [Azonexus sp.]